MEALQSKTVMTPEVFAEEVYSVVVAILENYKQFVKAKEADDKIKGAELLEEMGVLDAKTVALMSFADKEGIDLFQKKFLLAASTGELSFEDVGLFFSLLQGGA